MEQNGKPKLAPRKFEDLLYDKGGFSKHWGKHKIFKERVLGQLSSYSDKDKSRPITHTIHKHKLQMDQGCKRKKMEPYKYQKKPRVNFSLALIYRKAMT